MIPCPYINTGHGSYESRDWSVVLDRNAETRLPKIRGKSLAFISGGMILATLKLNGDFTIKMGYACDGYSPTVKMFGKWRRITPTPKRAGLFPAILHDILRQFCEVEGCPWDREYTDVAFYDCLRAGGENSTISGIYYGAVSRTVGDIYHHFSKHDPKLHIEVI